MSMAVKIRMLLAYRGMELKELAQKLGVSPQNLSQKMGRDNFREKELQEIAEICGAEFEGSFTLKDSGKNI
ncbi:MAG: helix-turn-helix domain-containing protein [Clostridia bacterium]|nr:helix-turn-helix domain-containing protein [Clostridia bacterium]